MEHENRYASRGVGNTALGLSIGALSAGALSGSYGNILGNVLGNGNGNCNGNGAYVNRYELGLQQEIAAKDTRIGLLESNIYTDSKIADSYERTHKEYDGKIYVLEQEVNQQKVINAQLTANLACMQNAINTLMGLTKTIIPIGNVCPPPMPEFNSWTAPTATAAAGA